LVSLSLSSLSSWTGGGGCGVEGEVAGGGGGGDVVVGLAGGGGRCGDVCVVSGSVCSLGVVGNVVV
jgi:hypothetical protein